MDDINTLDPIATLARLRRLIDTGFTGHLRGLSENELIDIILCAGGFIKALGEILPPGMMDKALSEPPSFGN